MNEKNRSGSLLLWNEVLITIDDNDGGGGGGGGGGGDDGGGDDGGGCTVNFRVILSPGFADGSLFPFDKIQIESIEFSGTIVEWN
ncbi:hypothetical protein DERF_005435 [Dermatophagoides farinae]|uniref:Uncharacterized protein n=1 Tax=Dermatophagoides farinae TaxID=6954 RepID=A0A922I9E8_DERFA|nr:hypothetical protein DERF_005435 [Dermatophagoides farinae]